MHPSVARAERTPDPPAALSIPPATELSGRDSDPAGQSRPGWLRLVACTQSLLLCSPAPDGPPHPLTRAARVPTARGSPLPHPTNTAAPLACAMRSAARARPEPGAQQEKEGASAAGGTRGAAGGARHSHSRPASRVARPISACRRSRALRGTRSLAWRAPPNEPGTRPRSQVCKLGLTTAAHRWRKRGGLGTCRGSGFPRSVHGYLFAQVAGLFLCTTPCLPLAAQLTVASSHASSQALLSTTPRPNLTPNCPLGRNASWSKSWSSKPKAT